MSLTRAALGGLVAAILLAGCKVGPNYQGAPKVAPNAAQATAFTRAPKDVLPPAPTTAKWWESLGDPELDHLIETALARSPDIRAAEARLLQAADAYQRDTDFHTRRPPVLG